MKIAVAIENLALKAWKEFSAEKTASVAGRKKDSEEETNARDLFVKATVAYRQLISQYQRVAQTLESRDAIEALTHYGDICVAYLDQPQEAYKAYKMILQSSQLAPEKRQEFQAKAQQAAQMASKQAKKAELLKKQQAEEAKRAAAVKPQEKTQQTAVSAVPKAQKLKPDIPIQKKIKLVPETAAPAKYQVGSVSPLEANKVSPVPGGLDLKRPSEAPLLFRKISVICVAQVPEITQRVKQVKKKGGRGRVDYVKSEEKRENVVADIFLSGQSRPYRIATDRIAYPQFFPKLLPSVLDNFRQFMLYLISQIDSVYLDQGTLNFLKTGKPRAFSSQEDLEIHEKIFWKQLMGAVRFQCEQCWEVYWIDGNKIPEAGVQTKCTKCGNLVFVQKMKSEL